MITNELFKRITTSLILFFFIYLCYLNNFFLKFGLFIVFVISFYEFINLLKKIKNFVKNKYSHLLSGEPVLTRSRHKSALKNCIRYMNNIDNQKSPELNAEELRLAVRSIEKITGKFEFEKLLDIVFRDFCIGK